MTKRKSTHKESPGFLGPIGLTVLLMLLFNCVLTDSVGAKQQNRKSASSRKLRSMARLYMAYGEYSRAQPYAEQALALARKTNIADYELAMCLIDMAYLYKNQNKLTSAEKMCKQGLELQQKCLDENHPYVANTLRILSSIYREQGKLYQAKSTLEKAVTIMRSSHPEDDYAMASLETDIAKLLVVQGKLVEAESHYSHVLSTINKNSPDHFSKARVLEDMAELYFRQGKYAEAEPLIDQALSMKEKVYGREHHFLIAGLFIKAGIEREKGNNTASEKFIQRALATAERTENITRIVKSQKHAAEIRSRKAVTGRVVAKAVN